MRCSDASVAMAREHDAAACSAAALEVQCRWIQAGLAAELLRRRLWRPLGFSRLSDYTGERLGLGARCVEDDARVFRALAMLPATRRAFADPAIRWTQARLVTRVATPDTEAGWLRLALTVTTRELARHTNSAARGDSAPLEASGHADHSRPDACAPEWTSTGGDPRESRVQGSTMSGGDPREAHARGSAPPAGDPRESLVHGFTLSGSKGPDACASQGMEAGADSTAPDSASAVADDEPRVRWSIVTTRGGRRLWHSLLEYASRHGGVEATPAQVAEAVAAEAMGSPLCDPPGPPPPARERSRRDAQPLDPREGFPWLSAPPRERPCALEHLLDGLADADAYELDARLRSAVASMQRIDARLGACLRAIADSSLHRILGFENLRLYAEARLGICGSKALALVRLERQCALRSPLLLEAYREGRIGWLATSALLPVITAAHASRWIQHAEAVTLRRLVADVRWALDRADEGDGSSLPGPPPPLDLDSTADSLARIDRAEVQMRAHPSADLRSFSRRVGARIAVLLPASVASLLEDAIEGCRRAIEPRWRGFERILAHAYLTWTAQPAHENPVFERDRYRCQVPGCSRRAPLHAHHVRFRSHGGSDDAWNLTVVCDDHHLDFLHRGRIRVAGRAPDSLVWELGCRPGHRPLMRLLGDVYLRG